MATKTPAMEARLTSHKMEDRIRFGSDGNGIFVVINTSRSKNPRWRLYDTHATLVRGWTRGYLHLFIQETEARAAARWLDHTWMGGAANLFQREASAYFSGGSQGDSF